MKQNVYEMVTDRIIAVLEKGKIPWEKPWSRGVSYSRATGKPYSLTNQLMLAPGEYLTFKQCKDAGGKVKKGEKSSIIVFWKMLSITEKDNNNIETEKTIPCLKYFNVFNIDQCDGIKAKYNINESKPKEIAAEPIVEAEILANEYIEREKIELQHFDINRAFYRPKLDIINIPKIEQFTDANEYYSTLYHEMIHSTGHTSRLNRLTKTAAFGNGVYSKEELIAEMGSAILINMMGIETPKTFKNSAAYIQSWINALRNDNKLIVQAAGKATKAIEFITQGKGE